MIFILKYNVIQKKMYKKKKQNFLIKLCSYFEEKIVFKRF